MKFKILEEVPRRGKGKGKEQERRRPDETGLKYGVNVAEGEDCFCEFGTMCSKIILAEELNSVGPKSELSKKT